MWYLSQNNLFVDLDGVVRCERRVARCHFENQHSQRPPVHRPAVALCGGGGCGDCGGGCGDGSGGSGDCGGGCGDCGGGCGDCGGDWVVMNVEMVVVPRTVRFSLFSSATIKKKI